MLTIHTERGAVHRSTLPGNGKHCMKWFTTARDAMFVRLEVRDRHGQMAALTNPVLLMRGREPGVVV